MRLPLLISSLALLANSALADIRAVPPVLESSAHLQLAREARRATPAWAGWDYGEVHLLIDKADLDSKVFAFGVICTAGDSCDESVAVSLHAETVKLTRRGNNLLLIPTDGAGLHPPALRPVLRLAIVDETPTALIVEPVTETPFAVLEQTSVEARKLATRVFDRFFHDFRSDERGVWFHETVSYAVDGNNNSTRGISTFSIYLIDNPFTEDFEPKVAIEKVGYFTAVKSWANENTYNGSQPFNPNQLKAIRWPRGKTIEWVVDRRASEEIYRVIAAGITDWNRKAGDLTMTVRRAEEGEELDSPFKNVFMYLPNNDGSMSAYAGFTYNAATGEIFRGTVFFSGPETLEASEPADDEPVVAPAPEGKGFAYAGFELVAVPERFRLTGGPSENERSLRGITSHEVGHVLGLRHNFKGSLYANDPEFPGGSSVMEYTLHSHEMKIGPYDEIALAWGYMDRDPDPEATPPFCTDDQAGYVFMMPAIDPECHRFDATTADHFATFHDKALRLLNEAVPDGRLGLEEDSFNVLFLGTALNYIRHPEDPFYDAEKSDKASELLALFTNYPADGSNEAAWHSAAYVAQIINSNLEFGLLTPRALAENTGFAAFLEWFSRSRSGSDETFKIRKEISVALYKLANLDPYGMQLVERYQTLLTAAATTTRDPALKMENEFLVRYGAGQ